MKTIEYWRLFNCPLCGKLNRKKVALVLAVKPSKGHFLIFNCDWCKTDTSTDTWTIEHS